MLNDKIFTRCQLALAIYKISNILLIREENRARSFRNCACKSHSFHYEYI